MDFAFTEEQMMFKDQVIRFATKEIVPRAREHDLKGEFDFQSFRRLGEFGVLGLHFPESLGGSDADMASMTMHAQKQEDRYVLNGNNSLDRMARMVTVLDCICSINANMFMDRFSGCSWYLIHRNLLIIYIGSTEDTVNPVKFEEMGI